MLLKPTLGKVHNCSNCELWSPAKHMLTAKYGLCEKYGINTARTLGVCLWRSAAPIPNVVAEIETAYKKFKARYSRHEIGGIRNAMPKQRTVQTDFNDDLEA